jgi:Domain of unknown function (DUF4440)
MKKVTVIVMIFMSSSFVSLGQSKPLKKEELKDKIITLEKAAWIAWKDKDASWFQNHATDECLWVFPDGVKNKTQMVKSVSTDCNVKSVSLDNFQFVELNDKTVVVTFISKQEAHCGRFKLPNKMRASVTYVNRNGEWLEAFYTEMPIPDK